MKRVILLLLTAICSICAYGQESVKPTFGVKLERKVDFAVIEGKIYNNIVVEIDAADWDNLFVHGVKIIVRNGANLEDELYKKDSLNPISMGFQMVS